MAIQNFNLNGTYDMPTLYLNFMPLFYNTAVLYSTLNDKFQNRANSGYLKIRKVPTAPEMQVRDYDILNGISLTQGKNEYLDVVLNQSIAINELIDREEMMGLMEVPIELISEKLAEGMRIKAMEMEKKAEDGLIAQGTASTEGSLTEDDVYQKILNDIFKIRKIHPMLDDIKVVIDVDTERKLLTNPIYANSASETGISLSREGVFRRIGGAETIVAPLMEKLNYVVFARQVAHRLERVVEEIKIVDIMDDKHIGAKRIVGRWAHTVAVTNPEMVIFNQK